MEHRHISAQLNPDLSNNDDNFSGEENHLEALVPGQTTESFRDKFYRKFGRIPRTVGACCLMLLLGIILLVVPSLTSSITKSGRIGMYTIGSLLLIPSIYVAYILYHVFNDTPGFEIDGLPLWDE